MKTQATRISDWEDDFDDRLDNELEILQKEGAEIIDIKFSSIISKDSATTSNDVLYSALIIYQNE